jgi:hypothetical protein
MCDSSKAATVRPIYNTVSVTTPKGQAYSPVVTDFLARYDHAPDAVDCDGAQLNIDSVHQMANGKGINGELALAAGWSKKSRAELGKLMVAFRDKNHDRGFDATLVYDIRDNNLVIYGISPVAKEKVYTSSVRIADLQNKTKVDAAICHVLVNIPVLETP